jgi:hypothetical protein
VRDFEREYYEFELRRRFGLDQVIYLEDVNDPIVEIPKKHTEKEENLLEILSKMKSIKELMNIYANWEKEN